jgi:hypothetical protein
MTKRLQIAEWLPYSRGMQGHGRPVRMRQRIPLMHARVVRALSSWPHNAFGIKSCIMRHSISSKSCSRIRSHFRLKPPSHAPAPISTLPSFRPAHQSPMPSGLPTSRRLSVSLTSDAIRCWPATISTVRYSSVPIRRSARNRPKLLNVDMRAL